MLPVCVRRRRNDSRSVTALSIACLRAARCNNSLLYELDRQACAVDVTLSAAAAGCTAIWTKMPLALLYGQSSDDAMKRPRLLEIVNSDTITIRYDIYRMPA